MDPYGTETVVDGESIDVKPSEDDDVKSQPHSKDGYVDPGRIFVGGLALHTTPDEFLEHFQKYGEITDHVIMRDKNTGCLRGFGYVTYADSSVVDKVIQENHILNGKQLGIEWATPKFKTKKTIVDGISDEPNFKTNRIFVHGIPSSVDEGGHGSSGNGGVTGGGSDKGRRVGRGYGGGMGGAGDRGSGYDMGGLGSRRRRGYSGGRRGYGGGGRGGSRGRYSSASGGNHRGSRSSSGSGYSGRRGDMYGGTSSSYGGGYGSSGIGGAAGGGSNKGRHIGGGMGGAGGGNHKGSGYDLSGGIGGASGGNDRGSGYDMSGREGGGRSRGSGRYHPYKRFASVALIESKMMTIVLCLLDVSFVLHQVYSVFMFSTLPLF